MIKIIPTTTNDLENTMNLWNDGEVMFYVGYPNGLNVNLEKMAKWLNHINSQPHMKHYSIYDSELGYCGESFYEYNEENDLASLDIKIFSYARGKGIAYIGLKHAIKELFQNTKASRCYVDPHPDNKKAWNLYYKLGFEEKKRPKFLEEFPTYLELTRETWEKPRLVQLSVNDDYLVYNMLQEIPKEENGFHNNVNSVSYSEYKEWLNKYDKLSKGIDLPVGFVPQTNYWLQVQGEYIGLIGLRHYLNERLKEDGGNIGYSIRPSYRGKGYGNIILKLVLAEARKLGLDKVLLTINKDNLYSLKVAKNNGGVIVRESDTKYYLEITL